MKKIKCYCIISVPDGNLVGVHPYNEERSISLRMQLKTIIRNYKKGYGYKLVIGTINLPKRKGNKKCA